MAKVTLRRSHRFAAVSRVIFKQSCQEILSDNIVTENKGILPLGIGIV